jgi:hypothetical protein
MPPIDALDRHLGVNAVLGYTLTGHGLFGQPQSSLLINASRLTDLAIREYDLARQAFKNAREQAGRFGYLVRGVGHLEAAVVSTHRALEFLTRLRNLGLVGHDGSPLVPRPKDAPVLSDSVRNVFRHFRDSIQHLDEKVIAAKAEEPKPIMLMPYEDRLELEGAELTYRQWVEWLTALHGIVDSLNRIPVAEQPVSARQPPLG